MMNSYIADKRIEDHTKTLRKLEKITKWGKWEQAQKRLWLEKYKDRLEKFIVNLDENMEDYPWLIKNRISSRKEKPQQPTSKNLGPPGFIFRSFKSEKARIKDAVKQNTVYQTEPISKAASLHRFRDRNKLKEIQPSMKFKTRNSGYPSKLNMFEALPYLSTHGMCVTSTGTFCSSEEPAKKSPKVYFKSAHSLLLSVGSLKPEKVRKKEDAENPLSRYDRLLAEVTFKGNSQKPSGNPELSEESRHSLNETERANALIKEISKKSKIGHAAGYNKHLDPILNVAEKVLMKCGVVEKKKNIRYGGVGRREVVICNPKEFFLTK